MKFLQDIIKNIETNLTEALTPAQKETVEFWKDARPTTHDSSAMLSASKDAMQGEHTVFLPLEHHADISHEIPSDIHSHLQSHGYKIPSVSEYKGGYAVDKHNRITTIGKALNRTNAPEELKRKFENDPIRQTKTNVSDLRVAITHHPEHIAGISTDRGWTSCMDMHCGINSDYIAKDLKHGTHAAYLVHKDDKNIENPIARISLKPFSNEYGHTILRPEKTVYGTGNSAFEHTVKSWAETHFPMQHAGSTYIIHPSVYIDTSQKFHNFSKTDAEKTGHFVAEQLKHHVVSGHDKNMTVGIVNSSANEHTIPHILDRIKGDQNEQTIKHHILTNSNQQKVRDAVLDSMSPQQRDDAIENHIPQWKYEFVKPEHISHYIDNFKGDPKRLMSMSFSTEDHAKKILAKNDVNDYINSASNSRVESQDFVGKLIDHPDLNLRSVDKLAARHGLSSENIHKLIDTHGENIKSLSFGANSLRSQLNFNDEHAEKLTNIMKDKRRYHYANVKGEDIPEGKMNKSLAQFIVSNGRNEGAMNKAIDFFDKSNEEDHLLNNVHALVHMATKNDKARHFMFNSGLVDHANEMENVQPHVAHEIALKTLTDKNINPKIKLKHLQGIMKEAPMAMKHSAYHAVKGTDMEQMARNGLDRAKKKYIEGDYE